MDLMIKENNNIVRQDIITQTDGFQVSNRYVPISTQEVIQTIEKAAGEVTITGFNNANVRKPGKDGFQKHAVICELPNAEMIDGTKMNLIIFNSSDRSTALKIFMGSLRMACSNQMVWGEQIAEPVSIRHSQIDWKHSVQSLMDEYEETQRQTEEMIKRMLGSHMSYNNIGDLTEQVAHEFGKDITGTILDPMQFNGTHRLEDQGKDAWHTFNRIQYNLLQGGIDRVIEKDDEDGILFNHISKTHKVTDASKQIEFNRKLHTMIMETI